MNELTSEDMRSFLYFIIDKGDVERCSTWDNKKHLVAQEYPELINAIASLDAAEKSLRRIAESIAEEIDDE